MSIIENSELAAFCDNLLMNAQLMFSKYQFKANINQFRLILEEIQFMSEDEESFQKLFSTIDQDGDGIISYEEFKKNAIYNLSKLGEETGSENEDEDDGQNPFNDSQQSRPSSTPIITIEKISECKRLFTMCLNQSGSNKVKLLKMKEIIMNDNFIDLNEEEFGIIFQDFLSKSKTTITLEEFNKLILQQEQNIFSMLHLKDEEKDQKEEYILNRTQTSASIESDEERLSSMPTLHKDSTDKNDYEISDYTAEEYILAIEAILDDFLEKDAYKNMDKTRMLKLLKDIANYKDVVLRKVKQQTITIKDAKAKIENMQIQEEFLQNKILKLQSAIEEIDESRNTFEKDAEQLFSLENDYERVRQRNIELDEELHNLRTDYESMKRLHDKVQREMTKIKGENKRIEEKNRTLRSDIAELQLSNSKILKSVRDTQEREISEFGVIMQSTPAFKAEPPDNDSQILVGEAQTSENKLLSNSEVLLEEQEQIKKAFREVHHSPRSYEIELKKKTTKLLQLQDELEEIKSNLELVIQENDEIKKQNEEYIDHVHKMNQKNRELLLIKEEMEEEITLLTTRVRHLDFIKKHEGATPATPGGLRASYIRASMSSSSVQPKLVVKKESQIFSQMIPEEDEYVDEVSLAGQLGLQKKDLLRESAIKRAGTKTENEERLSFGMMDIRASALDNKDYFKGQTETSKFKNSDISYAEETDISRYGDSSNILKEKKQNELIESQNPMEFAEEEITRQATQKLQQQFESLKEQLKPYMIMMESSNQDQISSSSLIKIIAMKYLSSDEFLESEEYLKLPLNEQQKVMQWNLKAQSGSFDAEELIQELDETEQMILQKGEGIIMDHEFLSSLTFENLEEKQKKAFIRTRREMKGVPVEFPLELLEGNGAIESMAIPFVESEFYLNSKYFESLSLPEKVRILKHKLEEVRIEKKMEEKKDSKEEDKEEKEEEKDEFEEEKDEFEEMKEVIGMNYLSSESFIISPYFTYLSEQNQITLKNMLQKKEQANPKPVLSEILEEHKKDNEKEKAEKVEQEENYRDKKEEIEQLFMTGDHIGKIEKQFVLSETFANSHEYMNLSTEKQEKLQEIKNRRDEYSSNQVDQNDEIKEYQETLGESAFLQDLGRECLTDEGFIQSPEFDELDQSIKDTLLVEKKARENKGELVKIEEPEEIKLPPPKEKEEFKKSETVKDIYKTIIKNQDLKEKGKTRMTKQNPFQIGRLSKIVSFDFLFLRNNKKIMKVLHSQKEGPLGHLLFTDYIFKINDKKMDEKEKRIILITERTIYLLHPTSYKINRQINITDLTNIIIVKTSATLIALHFPSVMKGYKSFKIDFCTTIKMSQPKKKAKFLEFNPNKKKEVSSKNRKLMEALANVNFQNALKVGYIDKRAQRFWKSWSEKFCVLTNVGLLYYNDPNKRPRNLFPIIDSQITPIKFEVYKRPCVFKITAFSLEITFAAKSPEEYESWINAFARLQNEFNVKREATIKNSEEKKNSKKNKVLHEEEKIRVKREDEKKT